MKYKFTKDSITTGNQKCNFVLFYNQSKNRLEILTLK